MTHSTECLRPTNTIYSVCVRGEAYLALHQGSEALLEFQKIVDHRGLVWPATLELIINLAVYTPCLALSAASASSFMVAKNSGD